MSKMGVAPPPGDEARIQLIENQINKDLLGFLKNPCSGDLSNYKGHSYIYKMNEVENHQAHLME
jgi:hypothetical protein